MPFIPLSQGFDAGCLAAVRLIATDMDGTLTTAGKFTATLLEAFEQLATAGLQVWIVTGRSAGWVSGLVHYLPVAGAIAENGGIFYPADREGVPTWLVPIPDVTVHRQELAQIFQGLQQEFPQLQESTDNRFRLTDWTFDVQGLSLTVLETLSQRCQEWGWDFTYSTVQCHIKRPDQSKATGLQQVMAHYLPDYNVQQVVTVGDSPNDESLFDSSRFPLSVGVANVWEYRDRLLHQPTYITTKPEGGGFWELAEFLLTRP